MRLKTTVVGSYPVPDWLAASPTQTALRDAVMVVLKTQELAGIDVVADGELYRYNPSHPESNGMIDYVVGRMDGIRTRFSVSDLQHFRADAGLAYRNVPAGVVIGPIGEGTLNLPADYQLARPLTRLPLRFTCTGPHMLAKVVTDRHYNNRAELAMAIAQVLARQLELIDADVVQIDEANISGHPGDRDWALPAINHVLGAIHGQREVHICFGNYGGQTIQKGFYRDLLPFLNGLNASCLVLELARRGMEEIDALRGLDPRIGIGAGVIDIKDLTIETPDTVAHRLEQAARTLGSGRLRYANPDCGFWMLPRNVADGKMRALVEGRNLFEGRT